MTRRPAPAPKNRYAIVAFVVALFVLLLSVLLAGILLLTGGSLPSVADLSSQADGASTPQLLAERTAETPTPLPTPTLTPTSVPPTATSTETATPTATATPGVRTVVNTPLLNVRSGPDTGYPIVTEAVMGDVFSVLGRNEAGTWLRVCCVQSTQESWVAVEFMTLDVPLAALPVLTAPLQTTPGAQPAIAPSSPVVGLPTAGDFGAPGEINPLTGQPLPAERRAQRPLVVCINNDIQARPQSGLGRADVVYEYLLDGFGITRFSAVFYGEESDPIGPVQDARLINVYLGSLYDAGVACAGASDQVRFALKNDAPFPYLDIEIDDPTNTLYVSTIGNDERTRLRTSSALLRQWLLDVQSEKAPSLRGFTFGSVPTGGAPALLISIPYPTFSGSQVSYRYDVASGRYVRFLGGDVHRDGVTEQQLGVANVIIQFVPHEITDIVEDTQGNRGLRTNLFGSGKAIVMRNGLAFEGTWRSDNRGDLPRFFDLSGNEIPLQPGKSWISIVPETYVVSYQ